METRNKIIEEAGKLFITQGVRLVTMDVIAQSIGISKRTIYENFKDKNDLLQSFMSLAIVEHKQKAYEIMKGANNVIEALFNFGEFNYEQLKQVNPAFFDDIKKYHPEVFQRIMGNNELRNYEVTYTILKRGLNEGIFTREIDLEIANRFIHYTMDFVPKVENELKCDHLNIWRSVHLPYLKGICTPKGVELVELFLKKYRDANKDLAQSK